MTILKTPIRDYQSDISLGQDSRMAGKDSVCEELNMTVITAKQYGYKQYIFSLT